MEKTRGKEEGKALWLYPGGVRALGEGFGVEVDSDSVVEDSWGQASLDEVVGACAYWSRRNYVRRMGC